MFNLRPVSRGYNFVNVVYKVNYRKNYVQDSDIAGDWKFFLQESYSETF